MKQKGEIRRARAHLRASIDEKLTDLGRYRAKLGDGAGNVRVANKRNFAFARIEGRDQIQEVLNLRVPFRDDLPVIVAPTTETPNIWEVVSVDKYTLRQLGDFVYLPHHHEAHEFKNPEGGDDVTWMRKQQYIPLLVFPTDPPSMMLNVYGDWYQSEGELHYYEGGLTTDLSAYRPVAPPNVGRYLLICLDNLACALTYTAGDDFNVLFPPSEMEELFPTIPTNQTPLAAVLLEVDTTTLGWWNIYDVRTYTNAIGASVIGAAPIHGLLDNEWHENTEEHDPVHGDLIVATGTTSAYWMHLPHGDVYDVLEMPVAGNLPRWGGTTYGGDPLKVVRTNVVGAIQPNRIGLGTPPPNQNGVIALLEGIDPASGGANTVRLFAKNDGGQSKIYFMGDQGRVFEISGVLEDVTITVGAAGDFATLQAAVDWLTSWVIKGACVIEELDQAAYDEAVSFAGLLIAPGSTLTLKGDTRELPGLTYVDTSVDATDCMNRANLANGGDGICTLATNVARDQITVTGSIANPDFDADGWASGDRVIVFADDGVIYERIINSIDPGGAGTNVIEITVALPVGATLGNDGTAVGMVPNRSIERTAAGACIEIDTNKGVILDGWYLKSSTGASCSGLSVINGANCKAHNILIYAEDYGIIVNADYSSATGATGAISTWGSSYGVYIVNGAQMIATNAIVVACTTRGFASRSGACYLYATGGVATSCGEGYYTDRFSTLMAASAVARQCTTGYYAAERAYILATTTNLNNHGNGADYNPAVSDAWGNNNGSITWS